MKLDILLGGLEFVTGEQYPKFSVTYFMEGDGMINFQDSLGQDR